MPCRPPYVLNSVSNFNVNEVKFDPPVCNQLVNLNRHYYTQSLKFRGNDLYLHTDWFRSSGIKKTFDSKSEILVTLTPEFRFALKSIEELAVRDGLKLPVEFQSNLSNDEIFKHLPERETFYLKLNYDATCWDKYATLMKQDAATAGDYRAVVHVKGLYIGHHPSGKLVSLQLRIVQLQFIQSNGNCMFAKTSSGNKAPITVFVPETPQPGADLGIAPLTAPLTQVKRGRKPANKLQLQRQNAITEARVQQEEARRLENVPADFFTDAMMDLQQVGVSQMGTSQMANVQQMTNGQHVVRNG